MKIFFVMLFIIAVFSPCGICANSPLSKHPITSNYKYPGTDITYSVDKTVNEVNLAKYRKELEKKQNELIELENGSGLSIVKNTKKIKLKQQISELKENIRVLEDGI